MAAKAAPAACNVITNAKGVAVRCIPSSKKAEVTKARADVAKLAGYNVREMPKAKCPLCSPQKQAPAAEGAEPEGVTLHEPEEEKDIYSCHECGENRAGQFKLMIKKSVWIRICKDCGGLFDLDKLEPWRGTQ